MHAQFSNTIVLCSICGGIAQLRKRSNIRRQLTEQDLRITDSRYGITLALWQCLQCGFIFADRRDLHHLSGLYEELVDFEYVESHAGRILQMRWLLDLVMRAKPDVQTLLDVGAGTGILVAEAQRRDLAAVGVEPSRWLVSAGKRISGVELLQGFFPHPRLVNRTFDVICLVDVLEHLADPVQMLRNCVAQLASGGLVLVVTPDVESLPAKLLGNRWWHYRLAHVGYFSRRSLEQAALHAGLRTVQNERAKWFFSLEYIAGRLAHYLPFSGFDYAGDRPKWLRRLLQQVVQLNPRDSMVLLLSRDART